MKKIYLTERQVSRMLAEIDFNGDQHLLDTGDANTAAGKTVKDAQRSGLNINGNVPYNVTFSSGALKKTGKVVAEYKVYSKRQIQESIRRRKNRR